MGKTTRRDRGKMDAPKTDRSNCYLSREKNGHTHEFVLVCKRQSFCWLECAMGVHG